MSTWMYAGRLASSAQFAPSQLAGLVLDLDADLGVTLASGNVSTWADQSGLGNDVSQGTAGNRPGHTTGWRNGHAAVVGAAGKSLARGTLNGGPFAHPTTFYFVIETPSTIVDNKVLFDGTGGANRQLSYLTAGVSVAISGASLAGPSLTVSTPMIWRTIFNGASSSIQIEPHGAAVTSTSGNTGSQSLVGAFVLSDFASTGFDGGKLSRVLMYSRLLDSSEDAAVRGYLRSRYAIVPSP